MKAYVTGGLGFIGARVIERLVFHGVRTICVDRREKLERIMKLNLPIGKRILRVVSQCEDLQDPDMIYNVDDNDVLIHLGAVVNTKQTDSDIIRQNIDYPRNVFSCFQKVVFASSGAVYGNSGTPDNVYGLTKSIGEKILFTDRRYGIALRFMNVYGEDEHHKGDMASMPFKMALAYEKGQQIDLFNITDRRDFVHVDDVASACMAAAARITDYPVTEIYDVGTGEDRSFKELDDLIRGDNPSMMNVVGFPSELSGRYQRFTRAGNMNPKVTNIFDQEWYKGTQPMKLQDGVRRLVNGLKA